MSTKFPSRDMALAKGLELAGVGPDAMEGPYWIRVANPSNLDYEPGIYDVQVFRITMPDGNRVAIGVAPLRGRLVGKVHVGDWELWIITDGKAMRV
jgi:hypothetical protein